PRTSRRRAPVARVGSALGGLQNERRVVVGVDDSAVRRPRAETNGETALGSVVVKRQIVDLSDARRRQDGALDEGADALEAHALDEHLLEPRKADAQVGEDLASERVEAHADVLNDRVHASHDDDVALRVQTEVALDLIEAAQLARGNEAEVHEASVASSGAC